MRQILVALVVFASGLSSFAQEIQPPLPPTTDLQELSRTMQSLQSLVQQSAEAQRRVEQNLQLTLQRTGTDAAKREATEEAQLQQLSKSYDAGARVLEHIAGATRTVSFAERLLLTEVHLEQVTNPWGDKDLRNAWDRVDALGGSAGLALAAAAALGKGKNGSVDTTALGSGLLITLGSRLLGHYFGGTAGKSFTAKVQFVEFTRRAYDDLNSRNEFMTSFLTQNGAFLGRIATFSTEYAAAASGNCGTVVAGLNGDAKVNACKAQVLLQLDEYVGQFDQVLDEIPAILALYDKLLLKYDEKKLTDPVLVSAFKNIRVEIGQLRQEYQAVRSFLQVRPELEGVLLAWRNPVMPTTKS